MWFVDHNVPVTISNHIMQDLMSTDKTGIFAAVRKNNDEKRSSTFIPLLTVPKRGYH